MTTIYLIRYKHQEKVVSTVGFGDLFLVNFSYIAKYSLTYMLSALGVSRGVSGGRCLTHGWSSTSLAESRCFASVWSKPLRRSLASSDTPAQSCKERECDLDKMKQ